MHYKIINLISKQRVPKPAMRGMKIECHKIFIGNETVLIQEHQSL